MPLELYAAENNVTETSFFSSASLHGNLQLYHYDINPDLSDTQAYATALGGRIRYKDHLFYRFGAAIEYAGSHAIGKSENPRLLFLFDNDANSTHLNALSAGYIYYQNRRTYFQLGAQTLNTPLFNEDSTKIVPWSALAATMTYDIPDKLTLIVSYISKIRRNTSSHYKRKSASGAIDDGLLILGSVYHPTKDDSLMSYLYLAPDLYHSIYLQYEHAFFPDDDLFFCLGAQYIHTFKSGGDDSHAITRNPLGGDDVNLVSLKAEMDYKDLQTQFSYSQNFGESGINNGYGGLSKVYTSSMIANGRKSHRPQTFSLKSDYDILQSALGNSEVALWLTHTDYKESEAADFFATYVHFDQRINLDTSLKLRYENINYKSLPTTDFLRIIFKYTF